MDPTSPTPEEPDFSRMMLDGEAAPYGISMHDRLDALLEYVRQNERVCPRPDRWKVLWEMLPGRRQVGGGWHPPLPLILAAWYAPARLKMMRLEEHIRYADAQGALEKVDRYLRRLPESEWVHLSDLGRNAAPDNATDEPGK